MTIVRKAKAALVAGALATVMAGVVPAAVQAQPAGAKKPNILIIWGDDIGGFNISAYNMGMMGYKTPNIDRIAKEGALFTDWYGQQSCTAGRAAFITGQSPIRTGLTKVGLPGAPEGLQKEDPTLADLLKAAGLRHRPVRQEPPRRPQRVLPDGPRLRRVLRQLLPLERGAGAGEPGLSEGPEVQGDVRSARRLPLLRHATRTTRPWTRASARSASRSARTPARSTSSAWRRSTRKSPRARSGFMDKAHKDGKPFFVWWNSTRMHVFTHLKPASVGKTGLGIYADGMVEHDGMVGRAAGQAQGTGHRGQHHRHVLHRQRRGVLHLARRRHDDVPRREEHPMGRRLPRAHASSAGPASSSPARIINDIAAHEDMIPTLLAAAATPPSRKTCSRARRSATRPSRSTSTATT